MPSARQCPPASNGRVPPLFVANPAAQALPGGYRFGDYANVGLPMLALPMVSAVILATLIYLEPDGRQSTIRYSTASARYVRSARRSRVSNVRPLVAEACPTRAS